MASSFRASSRYAAQAVRFSYWSDTGRLYAMSPRTSLGVSVRSASAEASSAASVVYPAMRGRAKSGTKNRCRIVNLRVVATRTLRAQASSLRPSTSLEGGDFEEAMLVRSTALRGTHELDETSTNPCVAPSRIPFGSLQRLGWHAKGVGSSDQIPPSPTATGQPEGSGPSSSIWRKTSPSTSTLKR